MNFEAVIDLFNLKIVEPNDLGLRFILILALVALLITLIGRVARKRRQQRLERRIATLSGRATSVRRGWEGETLMPEELFSPISEMAEHVLGVFDELGLPRPDIEYPEQVFSTLSPGMRQKLAIFVDPPFAEQAANMVNQKMEAVTKWAELLYRVEFFQQQKALDLHKTEVTAKMTPLILEAALKGAAQMREKLAQSEHVAEIADKATEALMQSIVVDIFGQFYSDISKSAGLGNPPAVEPVLVIGPPPEGGGSHNTVSEDLVEGEIEGEKLGSNGQRQAAPEYRQ